MSQFRIEYETYQDGKSVNTILHVEADDGASAFDLLMKMTGGVDLKSIKITCVDMH